MKEEILRIIKKNKKDIKYFTEEMEHEKSIGDTKEQLRYHCLIESRQLAISDLEFLLSGIDNNE